MLVKKGSPILKEVCLKKVATFPPSEEVYDTVDLCKDELRYAKGFWKDKAMAVSAPQVGKPHIPLFIMCKKNTWYTPKMYKTFQVFLNPQIIKYSEQTVTAWEGCLSNDEEFALVERPMQVQVQF